jgi:hypothetical protein
MLALIKGFFAGLPIDAILAALAVVLVLCLGYGLYSSGKRAARAEQAVTQLKQDNATLERQLSVKAKVEVITQDRIVEKERIRTVTKEIIRNVNRFIPSDSPDLPGGFRVLHDAAAQGTSVPDSPGADAAPVPARDAAATVAKNYGSCLANADQLVKLQAAIRANNSE